MADARVVEERNHAMVIVRYLADSGAGTVIPGVEAPQTAFADVLAPVALALAQERRVTGQINAPAALSRDAGDHTSEQFMQWLAKEQVEEVATMGGLLRVVERARDNPLLAEDYLVREDAGGDSADPGAPSVAGGAV